jgi:transcription elongation factor SPT4
MAEEARAEVVAPAPTDWGKNLRCCIPCRLVKTLDQFYEQGCENCPYLGMEGDRERVYECTTTEFQVRERTRPLPPPSPAGQACRLPPLTARSPPALQGLSAVMDPATSWCAKWMRARKYVPGCYALAVVSDLPSNILELLENEGVQLRSDELD